MTRWEPLPYTIGVDARRLATQLRRMKDRSGLGVPVLATRTARGTEDWMRYLNGQALPPLDAAEVLAQLSGADQRRLAALWELAALSWKDAAAGIATSSAPVPDPDPLDPLGPGDGLPSGRRGRTVPLAVAGGLAVAALATLLVAGVFGGDDGIGPAGGSVAPVSTGDGPGGGARPGSAVPGGVAGYESPGPSTALSDGGRSGAASAGGPADGGATAAASPKPTLTGKPPTPQASGATSGVPAPGGGTASGPGTATASATANGGCLKVITLGVCLGG